MNTFDKLLASTRFDYLVARFNADELTAAEQLELDEVIALTPEIKPWIEQRRTRFRATYPDYAALKQASLERFRPKTRPAPVAVRETDGLAAAVARWLFSADELFGAATADPGDDAPTFPRKQNAGITVTVFKGPLSWYVEAKSDHLTARGAKLLVYLHRGEASPPARTSESGQIGEIVLQPGEHDSSLVVGFLAIAPALLSPGNPASVEVLRVDLPDQ